MGLKEKIAEIEKEISRTQKNKATEKHLGLLKSRLIKYKLEFEAAGGILQEKKPTTSNTKGKDGKNKKGGSAVVFSKPERLHRKQNEGSSTSEEENSVDDESSDSVDESSSKGRVNPFAVLEDNDVDRESSLPEGDLGSEVDEEGGDSSYSDSTKITQETKKISKKKKKKGSRQALGAGEAAGDSKTPKPLESMTEDELIELFAAQNLRSSADASSSQTGKRNWSSTSTCLNAKLFNYRYEFKKTVGKSGMAAMVSDASAQAKPTRGLVKGIQYLIVNQTPNSYDPKMVMDQFIELQKDPKRPNFLVFKRLKKYKELQRNFLMMVYSNQDQIIQDIIHEMPFHTDALLLMCNIYERDDNISSARQAIENALLGLQSSFDFQQRNHPELHRMSYRYPANRSYFVTLFKHIVFTAPRFPATALELGKYLFNLNLREDPLAVILMMDHLALRAKDYSFLIAFYQAFQEKKHLEMLPNYAYSLPLALFARGTAKSSESDLQAAGHLLTEALMKFPGVFRLLVEKLDIPREKQSIVTAFSRLSTQEDIDGLELLQALYVRRCVDFWKDQTVISWLLDIMDTVVQASRTSESQEKLTASAENRKRLYRGTPSTVWRHVLLLNIPYSEQIFQMRLPADAQSFVFPFDPIPPTNSEEKDEWDLRVHLSPQDRRRSGLADQPGGAIPPVENGGPATTVMQLVYNATGEFLRQLLPSTAVAAEPDPTSLIGGEVVMGAPITDQDEEAGDLRDCMDLIGTYLEAAEEEALV